MKNQEQTQTPQAGSKQVVSLHLQETARKAAAKTAVGYVKSGMVVGLGTGNTASFAIMELAEQKLSNLRCVPTSTKSALLAKELGFTLISLQQLVQEKNRSTFLIDITIDGADEIDPSLQLIKGKGGALLFEKIVAACSKEVIIIADQEKQVQKLGEKSSLPIEVVPFGAFPLLAQLQSISPQAVLRMTEEQPYLTDGGNYLIDFPIPSSFSLSAQELHSQLKMTTGVIETGFFFSEASKAIIGFPNGTVKNLTR